MRIVFLGNDRWSVPPLEALAADADTDVALVITNPPRPAGRGSRPTRTAVAEAAGGLGLPLAEVEGVRDGDGWASLNAEAPDALVVVAYGELLSRAVLDVPAHGAFNLHFSLLPRWRGASPVRRAILAGDRVTGVTVMRMDEGLDTGPVLARREEPIDPDDDAGTLGGRLARLGGALLVETLHLVVDGPAVQEPQDEAGVTLAPKLRPEERVIDWGEEAAAIVRRVRALAPTPGATTTFRGQPLKVLSAGSLDLIPELTQVGGSLPPGTLTWREGALLPLVETGGRPVALKEVGPAGRRRMAGADWARGARLRPGERLG